ncbi:nucleotidyltransferase family protein [Aquipseudomonas ullengensis]|uniref:Nucleotidyltransferase family protein n=1 Tax=Aquipseudomonas ullengensis TaxID=2759166 RepID=A0A7W4QAD8_9GAMM|nr:nucleotidyltransferase family protein [Pseudomonas ullengensis]MBB2495360.1 nucleotidyltransferase family protein [Pseudomonas ullengensis]
MADVIALILAAGQGRRFGSDKRRALLTDGRGLLATCVAQARQVFDAVWVVLREDDDPAVLGLPADQPVIRCADAQQGMGHSLAAGVQVLLGRPESALAVLLGDMPWIDPASLRQLVQASDAEHIVFPLHRGQRGHPVLFGRQHWSALTQLHGDQGAKAVLAAHESAWRAISLDDPGVLRDVDTPQALG